MSSSAAPTGPVQSAANGTSQSGLSEEGGVNMPRVVLGWALRVGEGRAKRQRKEASPGHIANPSQSAHWWFVGCVWVAFPRYVHFALMGNDAFAITQQQVPRPLRRTRRIEIEKRRGTKATPTPTPTPIPIPTTPTPPKRVLGTVRPPPPTTQLHQTRRTPLHRSRVQIHARRAMAWRVQRARKC